MRSRALALPLVLLAACGGGGKTPAATPASPPASTAPAPAAAPAGPKTAQVSFADVGLDAAALDRSVAPCDDFYQYACGGWLATNEIPADKARYGRFAEIEDRTDRAVRAILDDLIAQPVAGDEVRQKVSDFYGSCLDEAAIEKRGIRGLAPLLGPVDKIKDRRSLQAALIALHRHGVPALWSLAVHADLSDLTANMIYVDTAGLGLPLREFYFEDDFAAARTAYQEHLVRLFGLLGKGRASARLAADVLALETRLAGLSKTGRDRRDPYAIYNPTDLAGLGEAVPELDWKAYFTAVGNPDPGRLSITTPPFVAGLSELIDTTKPEVWRAYLTVRVVSFSALALPKAIDDEMFTLEKALSGVELRPARWQRCVAATATGLPDYLGQLYVAKHFPGASKATAAALVAAIVGAMHEHMDALSWMGPDARVESRAMLDTLEALIGYPDIWRAYTFPTTRDDFAGNQLAAAAFEVKRVVAKAGAPYDRDEWLMPAFMVSAYHSTPSNSIVFPAGLLQPPLFAADHSIAVNLGGIGMAVGHELTHGFSGQAASGGRGRCLAQQYGAFEVLPGKFVNGRLTLNENLADLGGLTYAFLAYRTLRAGADPVHVADGLTEDQQFFVAFGQSWCSKDRPEEALKRLTDDNHSPPRWRVNGTVRNLPQFAAAFGCTAGQAMAPAETCAVW